MLKKYYKGVVSLKQYVNIQDFFLNKARKENVEINIFLITGSQLKGLVKGFDNYTIILEVEGKQELVYKHAISKIVSVDDMVLD